MSCESEARNRFAALSDADRSHWLDAAEAEFCAYGFEDASFNRILAAAKESKGRTYHYFAGKDEMFRATLERRAMLAGSIDETAALNANDAAGFWAEIASVCDRLTAAFLADAAFAELVRILHREVAARRAFAEPLKALERRTEALIRAGQSLGAVRDDLPLELLVTVALDLAASIDRWFADNTGAMTDAEASALSARAFSLLAAPFLPHSEIPT